MPEIRTVSETMLLDWFNDGLTLSRTFEFKTFAQGIAFVDAIAEAAEKADHHPDIDIRWNKVTLRLSTHEKSAGSNGIAGVTKKDLSLAAQCDQIYANRN